MAWQFRRRRCRVPCCVACRKCSTAGSRAAACHTHRTTTRLRSRRSLRTASRVISLPRALIRPADGSILCSCCRLHCMDDRRSRISSVTDSCLLRKCLGCILLMPSVLWCCWLGSRKSIRPVKIQWWGVGVDISVWSEVQIVCLYASWCHCHPKTLSSLASFKCRLVLPFWYQLTQVVLEKRPLNGCCCCRRSFLCSTLRQFDTAGWASVGYS